MKLFLQIAAVILIVIAMFSSCKKETTSKPPFLAGDTTNSIHAAFEPAMDFTIVWDSDNLYGQALDSLDLDQDQTADVYFQLNLLNQDNSHLLEGEMPNPFPSLLIYGRDSLFETAILTETVYVGLGQTADFRWVDTLSKGDVIDQNLKWKTTEYFGEKLWSEHPVSMLSNGPWKNKSGTSYVGFRLKGFYGWIEMNTALTEQPKILGYALSNNQ
jgi:hypothetical protein